ncbi:efflux RND transporter periplasmic adaptor subunit [Pengzhenrongella frigida]|uniref:Efflux RND transporter periplasmic adaptor subunit n=1 Tax=Pengzhenrongella frigida TaxID=1259133 RepID=A0A4Q5N5T6_9MICO|nr:efflux RND transporter periplasmic adaptor subunit [Cellulomonas sp. HLT2-17]RYV51491.1 efflux RND transporter periplasmic adaptor subunit [Cellulomonas sp. HLT2-17]
MLKLLRRTRVRTRVSAGILTVIVAVTGVYWFGIRDASASTTAPEVTSQAVAASLTTLEQSVAASGTVTPTVQEDVSFASGGTVTAVAVAAGQTVTAGQTLATIDTLNLNADLLAAKATLASAAAKLSDAQDDDDGTDASAAQIAASSAQVDVAQAEVDTATEAMAGSTLTAPVAGLLTEVNLTVGEAVTGSASSSGTGSGAGAGATAGATTTATTTSSAQFVIVGTDSWQLDLTVDDADVALIAVADQVEITLDGAEAPIFGTVAEIGLISTSTGGVAGFPVAVAVTGAPAGLYDGVSADAVIVYERRVDVLTVPSGAVRTVDGESTVTQAGTGDDAADITTVVTVGDTVDQMTEILTGLVEGDEVLVTVVTASTQQEGTEQDSTQERGTGEFPSDFPAGGMPGGMVPGAPSNG